MPLRYDAMPLVRVKDTQPGFVDRAVARRRAELRDAMRLEAAQTAGIEDDAAPCPMLDGLTGPAEPPCPMSETERKTKDEFEDVITTEGILKIVHIAGKGNFPKSGNTFLTDEYATYNKYWRDEKKKHWIDGYDISGELQMEIAMHLNAANVVRDFDELLQMIEEDLGEANKDKVVFTFDGDNYQENSPFTLGLAHLINKRKRVYGFKKYDTKQAKIDDHLATWKNAKAPYTGLVILPQGKEPKDYTSEKYDWYLSYGMPLFKSRNVRQPQKDAEITYDDANKFASGDKFNRKLVDPNRPGLVKGSVVTEYDAIIARKEDDSTMTVTNVFGDENDERNLRATLVKRAST